MGFKSRQPRGTNATPSRQAFCQGNTSQSQHTHAWAGQTQTIAPTGNGIPLFRRVNGKQLETLLCSNLAGSGYRVRTPRCISSVFFYATRRPRYNTRHTWAPHHQSTPAQAGDAQQVPDTAQNQPGSPAQHLIRSHQSFCCCPQKQDPNSACRTRTPPNLPDKPFGVYDAREPPFASFLPLTLTHNTRTLCDLLRPTTQSVAYTATKGERREFLALEGKPANERPSFRPLTYL